jgi:Cof subfamily protein (haloacid dehalogenase superfamily)
MIPPKIPNHFKLAAIDLDGTLLGPDHQISAANVQAVRQLQAAGAQVVLASGRHYDAMRKYADVLPDMQWIISCQGAELSDISRTNVLSRIFLPAAAVAAAVTLGQSLGFTPVLYTIEGVLTEAGWNEEMKLYTDLTGIRPESVSEQEMLAHQVFKVIWMGEPALLSKVQLPISQLPSSIQAVRTNLRFLELMPADASKGLALAILAAHLGISPSDAVAFGDGDNDIPMFQWAGLSVAMPHGWPAALKQATIVPPAGPPETAFARGVEMILTDPN